MTKSTLGLHTKEERDYARTLADQAFERGIEISRSGALPDLTFEIGILHAIGLLAYQENQRSLGRYVDDLKAKLDARARGMGR